jgi:hypothetical protein
MENNTDPKFNYKIVIIPILIFLFIQFYNAFSDDISNENTKELSSDDTTDSLVDDNNIITNNPNYKSTREIYADEDEPYSIERITRVLDKDEEIATVARTEDDGKALFIESENARRDSNNSGSSYNQGNKKTPDDIRIGI